MKKITQNLTNLKAWQSIVFVFMFLFSLTINSQEVGQEYLVNPGINTATGANSTTPETGVDGGGNFPANLGGWTNGTGGAYASASTQMVLVILPIECLNFLKLVDLTDNLLIRL